MSDIRYTVDIDVNGGVSNLKALQNQVGNVTKSFGGLKTAIGALAGAFAVNELRQFVGSITDATTQFETYQTVLTTFLGSQNAANRELARLQELANSLPQDLQDVTDAFVIFQRFGLDASNQGLTEFSNIATASGKSLNQLAEALADALTGEYERLKEFGIRVSNENGVIQASISGQIVATSRTAKDLVNQLQELGSTRFGGAAAANANTLRQSMSNLTGAVFETQIAFGEGLKPALIEINNLFAEFLRANQQVAQELGSGLGEALRVLAESAIFVANNISILRDAIVIGIGIQALKAFRDFSAASAGAIGATSAFNVAASYTNTAAAGAAGSVARFGGSFGAIGTAIRALTGPIGLTVAALVGLNKVISDVFEVNIVGEFSNALVNVAKAALNEVYEVFRNIEAVYDRLVGNDNIRNLSFEQLTNSGLDTLAVVEEMERRLDELVGPEWFQDLTMFESAERIRDQMKAYVEAARQKMAADEMMRLAEESAAEAAVERERIFREQLAPFQDYIDRATEYSQIDFSSPIEKAEERVRIAEETIAELNQAMAESHDVHIPMFNELLAASQEELAAATEALNELYEVGSFRGYFKSLIEESQRAVDESQWLQWALEDLDEALRNGAITPEVYAEALKTLNSRLAETNEEANRAAESLRNATEQADDYLQQLQDSTEDAQFELNSLNMTPLGREVTQITRDINRGLRREVEALNRAIEEGADPAAINQQIQRITSAAQTAIQQQTDIAIANYETQRSFAYGWREAFDEYQDNATNAARVAGEVFQKTTRGMEDAIVNFAKTGKFEFKDLVADILETILRSNIQRLIAQIFGGFGGGGGGGGGFNPFAGFFANGGTIPAGQFGIAGEAGPEIITGPATVTPMLGAPSYVTYNINAVDALSFRQLVARDPGFIHAVAQQGAKTVPGRRR